MTSPDGTRADNAVAARKSQTVAASADRGENGQQDGAVPGAAAGSDHAADPWFTPGPKVADADEWGADAGDVVGADDYATSEWFLPAGRAGLLPDSISVSWEQDAASRTDHGNRAEAAGAPPWAGEAAGQAAGTPPPWENGPWPGPGESAAERPAPVPPSGYPAQSGNPGAAAPETRRRSALIVLAGGVAGLILVVIIVVIVIGTSGGSGGCGTYPAAVRQAYATAMKDLAGGTSASVQAADLGLAARRANASAASARQISVRAALFAMASDLEQAHADVVGHRPVSPDLRQRLVADGTALPASCPS